MTVFPQEDVERATRALWDHGVAPGADVREGDWERWRTYLEAKARAVLEVSEAIPKATLAECRSELAAVGHALHGEGVFHDGPASGAVRVLGDRAKAAEARCKSYRAALAEVAKELRIDAERWLEQDVPHRFGAAKRCRSLASRLEAPDDAPQEPTREPCGTCGDARKVVVDSAFGAHEYVPCPDCGESE